MGDPDPTGAANTIRDVFGRMDWAGRELVALIGGGHAFGKAHGASTSDSGSPPNECPFNSWNGPTGVNAITSGFEGPWTTIPTAWSNEYFVNLLNNDWELTTSPAGNKQWRVVGGGPLAPLADNQGLQEIMMLTTDIAMKVDPEYGQYVTEFATNFTALTEAFGLAWYKLVTRDMGPVTRCAGKVSVGISV
jgi:catalase-peroxidase